VTLAVAFSGLTTFVVYYLALAVYDRTTALASAALLAVTKQAANAWAETAGLPAAALRGADASATRAA